MERTAAQILNHAQELKLESKLAHCFILGFEWAVVSERGLEMASREKPGQMRSGSRLIHLATYKGVLNEKPGN